MPNGQALGRAPAIDDPPERSSSESDDRPVPPAANEDDAAERSAARAWAEQRLHRKRKDALTSFFASLDFLVYVQLAAIYYLEYVSRDPAVPIATYGG